MTPEEIEEYISEHISELTADGFDNAPREVRDYVLNMTEAEFREQATEKMLNALRSQLDDFKANGMEWTGEACIILLAEDEKTHTEGCVSMIDNSYTPVNHQAAERALKAFANFVASGGHVSLGGYL